MVCNFTYFPNNNSTSEMEDLGKLSLKIDSSLLKFRATELLLSLTHLGINTEEKPGIEDTEDKHTKISWKMWIRNQKSKKQLCKIFLFFVEKFEGNNTGAGLPGSSKKITFGPISKSNRHHRM